MSVSLTQRISGEVAPRGFTGAWCFHAVGSGPKEAGDGGAHARPMRGLRDEGTVLALPLQLLFAQPGELEERIVVAWVVGHGCFVPFRGRVRFCGRMEP